MLRGIGSPPADPATTFAGGTTFAVKWKQHEDYATNFAHTVLILAGLIGMVFMVGGREGRRARISYAVLLVVAYLVFAGYLRWQPWITRLMIPLYVLGCPPIGLLLGREPVRRPAADEQPAEMADGSDGTDGAPERRPPRSGRPVIAALSGVGLLVAGYLGFVGGSWTWFNQTRPVAGPKSVFTSSRYEVRMYPRPYLAQPYANAAHEIIAAGVHRVGLARRSNNWEYPLWTLLGAPRPGMHIQDVTPTPPTAGLANPARPGAVICMLPDHGCRRWRGPGWTMHVYKSVRVSIRVDPLRPAAGYPHGG
jgi:hypothetical protein